MKCLSRRQFALKGWFLAWGLHLVFSEYTIKSYNFISPIERKGLTLINSHE